MKGKRGKGTAEIPPSINLLILTDLLIGEKMESDVVIVMHEAFKRVDISL